MSYDGGAGAARARPAALHGRGAPQHGASTCAAMLDLKRQGAVTFDYGNNLRAEAQKAGVADAFDVPRLRAGLHPPAVLRGQGPVPLGGALGRSRRPRRDRRGRAARPSRRTRRSRAGSAWRASAWSSRGCPRASAGSATASARGWASSSTSSCARARSRRPIVIGRDHLDAGSVASPNRETEAMKDGSDAIADWPILNALLERGGRRDLGVGPPRRRRRHGLLDPRGHGRRRRRDPRRRRRLQRVLTTDPAPA